MAGTCSEEEDEMTWVACQNDRTAFLNAERSIAHSSGQVCCRAASGSTDDDDKRDLVRRSRDVSFDKVDGLAGLNVFLVSS